MIDEAILNYVLTVGPYRGVSIGEAANLRSKDGTWNVRLMEEGIFNDCPGVGWMSWYLSHQCDWMHASGRVAADRKEIASFLVAYRKCYNIEPYKSWAGQEHESGR